jgi:hypothetical protein
MTLQLFFKEKKTSFYSHYDDTKMSKKRQEGMVNWKKKRKMLALLALFANKEKI